MTQFLIKRWLKSDFSNQNNDLPTVKITVFSRFILHKSDFQPIDQHTLIRMQLPRFDPDFIELDAVKGKGQTYF